MNYDDYDDYDDYYDDYNDYENRRQQLETQAKDELEKFQATFTLAGFKTKRVHQLVNGWWGPWYLLETDVGLIEVSWCKGVISVDWTSTGMKWESPVDPDVTRGETRFYAYGYDKLLEYLQLLRVQLVSYKHNHAKKGVDE